MSHIRRHFSRSTPSGSRIPLMTQKAASARERCDCEALNSGSPEMRTELSTTRDSRSREIQTGKSASAPCRLFLLTVGLPSLRTFEVASIRGTARQERPRQIHSARSRSARRAWRANRPTGKPQITTPSAAQETSGLRVLSPSATAISASAWSAATKRSRSHRAKRSSATAS